MPCDLLHPGTDESLLSDLCGDDEPREGKHMHCHYMTLSCMTTGMRSVSSQCYAALRSTGSAVNINSMLLYDDVTALL